MNSLLPHEIYQQHLKEYQRNAILAGILTVALFSSIELTAGVIAFCLFRYPNCLMWWTIIGFLWISTICAAYKIVTEDIQEARNLLLTQIAESGKMEGMHD